MEELNPFLYFTFDPTINDCAVSSQRMQPGSSAKNGFPHQYYPFYNTLLPCIHVNWVHGLGKVILRKEMTLYTLEEHEAKITSLPFVGVAFKVRDYEEGRGGGEKWGGPSRAGARWCQP